jgi:hypothetical protein
MKSFGSWDSQTLRETFGLQMTEALPALTTWINVSENITENELFALAQLRRELLAFDEFWNKEELKMNFIAPLMRLLEFGIERKYNIFYQRFLSTNLPNIEIGGEITLQIASGWESPIMSYFFLHQYKEEEERRDLRAQLLAAMLVAQAQNDVEKPIYGVYLIGASWRFVVLMGKEYAVKRFDATEEDDLLKIFQMLKWIKRYVEKEVGV